MKITLLMVTSINGKITHGSDSDISHWTSKEDFEHFSSMIAKANLIVMGSNTYEATKDKIVLRSDKLRIVLTRTPEKNEDSVVEGQLEFSNETTGQLIKRLEQLGYKEILLVGGGQINTLFLRENLVSELYLTLEPKLFGKGRDILAEGDFEVNIALKSIRQLNKRGTLLLHYIIPTKEDN